MEASLVLGDAFQRMRDFVATYAFKNEAEEIRFFKEIKPRLFYRLLYYRKVYNIEMNRPVGVDSQRVYLNDELVAINRYNNKRSDFIHYYRSGLTHLDSLYYLRGRADTALYLESFHYERDPKFSTNADFKVAKLLANEMLSVYFLFDLKGELEALEYVKMASEDSLPAGSSYVAEPASTALLIWLIENVRPPVGRAIEPAAVKTGKAASIHVGIVSRSKDTDLSNNIQNC